MGCYISILTQNHTTTTVMVNNIIKAEENFNTFQHVTLITFRKHTHKKKNK